jgi:uncharacterized protein YggT (Ycf19 family)
MILSLMYSLTGAVTPALTDVWAPTLTPAALFASVVPYPLNTVLYSVGQLYMFVIVVWAILSWFNKGKGLVNDVYQVLDKIVSPFVGLFRRFIPTAGGMDFSPLIAIILLQVVLRFLL